MKKIKEFLNCFLYFLGIKKKPDGGDRSLQPAEAPVYAGPQIIDSANAILMHHNDNVALVVDHDFKDVPSWIEWDCGQNKLAIAQMGGTITELQVKLQKEELDRYKDRKRLYLVVTQNGEKIIHSLSFIVRE